MNKELKDGEPCSHKGCLSHVTHPCEGCGRVAGMIKGNKSPASGLLARLKSKLNSLKREHFINDEDCWYSCPLSNECCDDSLELECNCGIDQQNSLIVECLGLVEEIEKQ